MQYKTKTHMIPDFHWVMSLVVLAVCLTTVLQWPENFATYRSVKGLCPKVIYTYDV